MKAKKESTKFFVDKTGDKIFVEMEITGNPDKAVHDLMESLYKGSNILPNLKINQIFFRNRGFDGAVENMKSEIKRVVNKTFDEVDKMFKPPSKDIHGVTPSY